MDYPAQQLAPFLYHNWRFLLGTSVVTLVIYVVVQYFTPSGATQQHRSPDQQNRSPDQQNRSPDQQDKDSEEDEVDYPLDGADVNHIPYGDGNKVSGDQEMLLRSTDFYTMMSSRRSLRFFSAKPVSRGVINNLIRTAGSSPSGANQQPWTFVVVESREMKKGVRDVVEQEEETNYRRRMGDRWVEDLRKFRTNWVKPYLELAPYLILVFKQTYGRGADGSRQPHYYAEISVSIACGILVAAIHHAGLVTLTSTPLNCGPQLRELLQRPENEKLLMLLPVGYPADDATVPDIKRKKLEEIMVVV